MGFPRPTKQWPITSLEYKGSLEWSIYRSFLPEILLQLELNIKKFNFKEGKYFLIRIEDYLVLFKVTEVWNDVIKLQFRCLETQGTSCHNLEVAKIDDYFDFAFNNYKIENKSRYFNSHIFHILQPVTALNLNVYSKSEGVFAGVLDTPNTLRLLQPTFFKVLVWFLLEKLDINILVKFANNIPLSQEIIKLYWEKFPLKWLLHLKATKGITLTKYAEESLILIAISIYCCVFNSSIYDDPVMSSDQIYTSYKGKLISYNLELKDWLKKHLILWKFSLKAFRYTTKIVYEQFVLNDLNNYEDVLAKIEDCDRNWLITVELNSLSGKESRDLHENFLKKHLSVYMLGQKKEDKSLFFRIFKITKTQGYVGELNGEVIKSIWANLNFELLYLANDDDERYSIQAHELLLRNLITQAADPPLGYPVYTVPAQISNEAGNYI
ncbi:hypothetical protein HK099_000616 [Clydaea vesicula]|uniref:Pecanex C-terminal domain-containing protein n=1 Tax=Clydaea vesicula TaxID=447962 RepID=A0AAD5U7Q8_9FUNG|nr:hypothetical protein HK099_000616 [Clydaea vesicula]